MGLVVKKVRFSPENGDENGSRRQNYVFFALKWRQEPSSSPKNEVSRLKMTTRKCFVVKKRSFSAQNDGENRLCRQNRPLLGHSLSNFIQNALMVRFM
ncbi:hypothetical protein QPM05_17975 [Caldibacillus thermoamylovorans]|nr:hypothetical protein [Caldibacillus thermoamylovorans]